VRAIDWIAAAAPQQNADALARLDGAIEIAVHDIAARTLTIGTGAMRARIECGGHDLVLWATRRGTWEELGVDASASPEALAAAQALHVF
jgi:hypothetical protein